MSKLLGLVAKIEAALKPDDCRESAGGDLARLSSAVSLASLYLFRIQPIGPLESSLPSRCSDEPDMTSWAEEEGSELSPVKLGRGLLPELPMDVALIPALLLEPMPNRGDAWPPATLLASSFLPRDNLHRLFFSFSDSSAVELFVGSSTRSASASPLNDEWSDWGGDFVALRLLSGCKVLPGGTWLARGVESDCGSVDSVAGGSGPLFSGIEVGCSIGL